MKEMQDSYMVFKSNIDIRYFILSSIKPLEL